jgi:hypothetical protein
MLHRTGEDHGQLRPSVGATGYCRSPASWYALDSLYRVNSDLLAQVSRGVGTSSMCEIFPSRWTTAGFITKIVRCLSFMKDLNLLTLHRQIYKIVSPSILDDLPVRRLPRRCYSQSIVHVFRNTLIALLKIRKASEPHHLLRYST